MLVKMETCLLDPISHFFSSFPTTLISLSSLYSLITTLLSTMIFAQKEASLLPDLKMRNFLLFFFFECLNLSSIGQLPQPPPITILYTKLLFICLLFILTYSFSQISQSSFVCFYLVVSTLHHNFTHLLGILSLMTSLFCFHVKDGKMPN